MTLRFITWDVEHGSAAYAQTPNGKHIVFDLGARRPAETGFSPLAHLWNQWGVRCLDLVVITHPHLDHIEDIMNFDAFSPKVLIRPSHLTEDEIWGGNKNASTETKNIIEKYIEIDKKYNQPVGPEENPSQPANNGGVSLEFFFPKGCPTNNVNNHSVVAVMTYEGVKFLLPGDNESCSWDELLDDQYFLQAIQNTHILVAPHHGRESGYDSNLFEYINPVLTVISDGRFVDTSATSRYSAVTGGWVVNRRNGDPKKRYCVTTRKDGVIDITVNPKYNQIGTLSVSID